MVRRPNPSMRRTVRIRPAVHLRPSMKNNHGLSSEFVHEVDGPPSPGRPPPSIYGKFSWSIVRICPRDGRSIRPCTPRAFERRALSNAARLMFVSENSKRWIACAGFLLISYWGIKCGIVKFIMIILLKDSFNFRMSSFLDEFYFRWWENSVIEIGKAVSIPLMFNHQNWNFYSSSRAEASFCKDEMKLELWTDDWCKRQRVSHL